METYPVQRLRLLLRKSSLDFEDRRVMRYDEVHVFNIDKAVAVRARRIRVGLGYDDGRPFRRRLHDINANTGAQKSVLIGGRGLNEGYIYLHHAGGHQ
jgi:hypothetical protein